MGTPGPPADQGGSGRALGRWGAARLDARLSLPILSDMLRKPPCHGSHAATYWLPVLLLLSTMRLTRDATFGVRQVCC
jgi:hypothetical protein